MGGKLGGMKPQYSSPEGAAFISPGRKGRGVGISNESRQGRHWLTHTLQPLCSLLVRETAFFCNLASCGCQEEMSKSPRGERKATTQLRKGTAQVLSHTPLAQQENRRNNCANHQKRANNVLVRRQPRLRRLHSRAQNELRR